MVLIASVAAACADTEEAERAAQGALAEAAQQDSVQTAVAAYDPSAYDTLTWENERARHERGQVVFSISCSKCHGLKGLGDAGFVQGGDTLRPPSLVSEEWKFAEDFDGLRQQIFTGTTEGMPHWGLHGLKYRDVDAVSAYISEVLRSSS